LRSAIAFKVPAWRQCVATTRSVELLPIRSQMTDGPSETTQAKAEPPWFGRPAFDDRGLTHLKNPYIPMT
jgi:hypothetical protein